MDKIVRILADENMPFVAELFGDLGELITMPGRSMTADDLQNIDLLLIRSITKVDQQLLSKANALQFVGSATIGCDHVDQQLLQNRGIAFAHAPGCNAGAVCDYVQSSILQLAEQTQQPLQGKTVGIIGVGNIGKRLWPRLEAMGMRVLGCDPIRAEQEQWTEHTPFEQLLCEADILSLHVPITHSGPYATADMLNAQTLQQLKSGAWLINSCRGDVIDNNALLSKLNSSDSLRVVMDVWQNEPEPLPELLQQVDIATPHIAGYSLEGKANGTLMLAQAWAEIQGQPVAEHQQLLPEPALSSIEVSLPAEQQLLQRLIHAVYPVLDDDRRMRQATENTNYFDNLRKHYPMRRELASTQIKPRAHLSAAQAETFYQIGFARP